MTIIDAPTHTFLELLHRGGTYAYWWTIEGKRSYWWPVASMPALPNSKHNIYVGVHPTVAIPTTTPRGEPAEPRAVRAQLSVIASINCLYCEYDAKDFDGDKDAAKRAAETMQPPASVIIDSGGGYHVYHFFDSPWILQTEEDHTHAKRLQSAWVAYAGSDPQVKDLARVLRVPGTLNYKYTPARPVSFVDMHFDRRYTRDTLETVCKHLMEHDRPATVARTETPESYEHRYALTALDREVANVVRAQSGGKHDVIRNAALKLGTFVPKGLLTEDQILDELTRAANLHRDDVRDTYRTVIDGIAYGKQRPRDIPPQKTPAPAKKERVDPTTGEIIEATNYVIDWRTQGVTLADLQYKEFPAERWIIEGILPEGACLLAAKYKSRKSWMSLAIGVAIAMGGKALGRLSVVQGDVLYLDLEGRQQRIQKRTRAMLGVRQIQWPDNFHIFTQWSQGDEGITDLEHWLMAHPNAALVIIDVLASFRRPMNKQEEFYRYDRDTVDPINALAEKYHVAIVLVHHFNKGKHDDIMDSITGSSGLPSAVNTMWALHRDINDSTIQILAMRGRDLENDDPLALKWDSYLNMHVIEGPANEVATSHERKAVMKVLANDESWTPKDLAAEMGKPVEPIKQLLKKLLNDGLIDKTGHGKYARVVHRDHGDHGDHDDHDDHFAHDQDIVPQSAYESDRQVPKVIPPDHDVLTQQEAVNANSDHRDRDVRGIAARIPPQASPFEQISASEWSALRMYARSNNEADQEIAQKRCAAYGIDYAAAKKEAQ